LLSFAIGVSNNDDPITSVRGAADCRWYAIPFRIKPARGQVSKNNAHPEIKQLCHVLHDRVARSYHAKGTHKFPVESRTLAGNAGALPGFRNILAWESTRDDIGKSFGELEG